MALADLLQVDAVRRILQLRVPGTVAQPAVTAESAELHERISKIASKVSDELVAHCRRQLTEGERVDTWEVERVILERMRGNPAARPATAADM